jgi:hypothetical protein
MFKNKFNLTIAFAFLFTVSYAQTANYAAGNPATPNNAVYTTPVPVTVLGAPGSSNTTGDNNTAVGAGASSSLSSGSNNVAVGTAAGTLQTNQSDNTYIGAFAGDQSTTGTDNVVIGTYAARTLNGSDNTVIGVEAGMVMTTGAHDNTIIGEEAGQALIDGDDNVFIGEDAGYNNTTASDNTFVGNTAGRSNTTGYGNAFFGDEAGYDNTTGRWNTAVGDSAGIDGDIGIMNTYIGHGAGCATEAASHNTFVGAYAGGDNNRTNVDSNTNAMRNTYLGTSAGFTNREGSDNVGIGSGADFSGNNRSRCIFIGGTGTNTHGQWSGDGFGMVAANDATSIGYQAQTTASYGIGIGHSMDQHGVESISMGYLTNTEAAGDYSVLMGSKGYLDKAYSVGLGYAANVSGTNSIALGANTSVTSDNSIAIGQAVTVSQANTMALGGDQTANRLSVGIGTQAANTNASLDLADVDKGFLVNRVTTAQRTAMISTPASGVPLTTSDAGLMVYDTDENLLYIWNGSGWGEVGSNAGSGVSAVPELLNYQSAVRNASGDVLANQEVSFRINVIEVALSSTVYSETHTVTTSSQGLVDFQIGGGTIVSGLFSDIDWSNNNSLQIELDVTGGTNYTIMGSTPFVSVPYALRAKYAENLTSSSHAKMSDSDKEDRIKTLENEVQELKKLVNKLISKK